MPKVNDKNLDGQIQEIIVKQLLYAISFLESPKQAASFFSDFLTDAETIMLSKRLAIAILLMRGHSQTLITKMLSVSYSATGAVASWLKNADPATTVILNSISQDDDWKELVYNFKMTNKTVKRGRKPASDTNSHPINTHPEFAPANLSAIESVDLDALEGPELVIEEADTSRPTAKSPSLDEMLEEI